MEIIKKSTLKSPLASLAFSRLLDAVALLPKSGPRSKGISHRDFILSGVLRPLMEAVSGRDALQKWAEVYDDLFDNPNFPRSSWFGALHTASRLEALLVVSQAFHLEVSGGIPERLAQFPELANYDVWTGDGHWHEASLHDQRYANKEGDLVKLPAGHIYFYNHRSGLIHHFATCMHGTQEHDMSVLQRTPLDFLRVLAAGKLGGKAKAKRTSLVIYDRAAVDFPFWNKAKREHGTNLITRDKSTLLYAHEEWLTWDETNPLNARIISDELVFKDGEPWRRITATRADQDTEDTITILTNDLNLPPGLICMLYHRRWDIERAYDDVKHKFHEGKAWGSSMVSKSMQGEFIALAWNVLQVLEHELAQQEVANVAEEKRRNERTEARAAESAERTREEHEEMKAWQEEAAATLPPQSKSGAGAGKLAMPPLESPELYRARRIRIPVKLIRWFRNMLPKTWTWQRMLERLRCLYSTL